MTPPFRQSYSTAPEPTTRTPLGAIITAYLDVLTCVCVAHVITSHIVIHTLVYIRLRLSHIGRVVYISGYNHARVSPSLGALALSPHGGIPAVLVRHFIDIVIHGADLFVELCGNAPRPFAYRMLFP